MIYTTDGLKAFAFYIYKNNGMNFKQGRQFIGMIVNGVADGQTDTSDGSYLRQPDTVLFGCK